MKPATPAAVESAVNILLQSIFNENQDVLEAMSSRNLPSRRADAKTQPGLLAHVDEYAVAIQSTLDNVQRQLLVKLSAVHTEHNRMIPLHRLPIEVFTRIITEASKSLQNYRWDRPTYLGRLVTLCRVCKQWRDVIHATASLWASIDLLDPPAITSAAISRAAGHSMNIIAAPYGSIRLASRLPDGLDEFTKTAMTLSGRWRSLQIVVPSLEKALVIMNAPAPLLQSLELKSTTEFRLRFKKGGILFHGTGPQLRRLGLHGVAIPWDSYLLRNLQYLSISQLKEFSPSCEEILGILRACPRLMELELSLKQVATARGRKKETPFTLAELQSLSLTLSTPCTLTLLETIRLPSIQSVSLNLNCNSDTDRFFSRIIKHAQALFSVVFNAQHTLLITFSYGNTLRWTCKPRGELCDGREFAITVQNTPARTTLERLIETFLDEFPAEVIEINFDSPVHLNLSTVVWQLDGVECIRNITASNCDLDPLFTYMSYSTTCDEWGFPNLEGITVYDCDYNPSNLLRMARARYGLDEKDDDDLRDLPPPLKWITISHASGEADEEILGLVKDILGPDCFEFDENAER